MKNISPPSIPFFLFPETENTFLLFAEPIRIWQSEFADRRFQLMKEAEDEARREGWFLAGGLPYEESGPYAAGWWGAFRSMERRSLGELRSWVDDGPVVVSDLRSTWDRARYFQAFDAVREALKRGDSYQVNLTFQLEGNAVSGRPWSAFSALKLWLDLLEQGQGREGVFAAWGDRSIVSLSPELFFSVEGKSVLCRPMKGTFARDSDPQIDQTNRESLLKSAKIRSENLMITDMIRNDLGVFAHPGTVRVPELFSVEAYPTVWQMTSTVTASLPPASPSLAMMMEALFPCASITGAPKTMTTRLISQIEEGSRGWYTGTLGWFIPQEERGRFNVLIRTLDVRTNGSFVLGVGGGIVWDSNRQEEWDEAWLKTRFLRGSARIFSLTEAMLWEPENGLFLLKEHLERLQKACLFFGGDLDWSDLQKRLLDLAEELLEDGGDARKIRVLVNPSWEVHIENEPLGKQPEVMTLALARKPLGPETLFWRRFKTTERRIYTEANVPGFDQTVFFNEKGELTESSSMNLVLDLGGRMLTPALTSGLLDGTFRRFLLETNQVEEARLTVADLWKADRIFLVNSVRRWKLARLDLSEEEYERTQSQRERPDSQGSPN